MTYVDDLLARLDHLGVSDSKVLRLVSNIAVEYSNMEQKLFVANEELYFDSLTGLPNKESFVAHLKSQIKALRQQTSEVSTAYLAIGDLNGFKSVNDRFGHTEGDNALKHVANVLQETSRASDFVSRFHGDEFGFLFTRVNHPDDVLEAKNRIQNAITSRPFEVCGQKVALSMSIGVIPLDATNTDIEQYLKAADLAMYQEKSECKIHSR